MGNGRYKGALASAPTSPAKVPGRLTRPGRPRRGAAIEPAQPHSPRVHEGIWQAVALKARKAGLTVSQAARRALLEGVFR